MPVLAVCGRVKHGKASADGGLGLCFACGQAGSQDGSSKKWRHVGSGPFWADLAEWAATVGDGWVHERDLVEFPFQAGECVCSRSTCVVQMYMGFKRQALKQEMGSLDVMVTGQSSPMGRYPSTAFQIRALLAHVKVEGGVLDCCGAAGDAVSTVLTAHSMHVTTNDFDPRMTADSHKDASTDAFREAFSEDARRPNWIVTSPPYSNAWGILKQALLVARVGVAFKLRLSFLEPTKTRGVWLRNNPPDMIVVLPKANYRGRKCCSVEAWLVWNKLRAQDASVVQGRPALHFALQ